MTEHFSFFDAIQDTNGRYDREYNAQQFTDYFKSLVTTGVMKGTYNQLEVTTNGANMVSSVKSGVAFVEGRYYFNDTLLELTHDTEVLGLSRIDRVVVRMDLSTQARHAKIFVKKGVPNSNPVAPTLTQTANLYEISLAQVQIVGGQTFIATNAVTDERGTDVICPWAGSKILPNFNDDALEDLINTQLMKSNGTAKDPTNKNIDQTFKSGFYLAGSAIGTGGVFPASGVFMVQVIDLSSEHSPGTVMQIAFQTNKTGGNAYSRDTWQRTYLSGTNTWQPWSPITPTPEYNSVYLNPLNGWSKPWDSACRVIKNGDFVTVYGLCRPTSASSGIYFMNVPTEYRLTSQTIAFNVSVPLTDGTWTVEGAFVDGSGDCSIRTVPVSQISLTQDMAFTFTYMIPR